MINIDPHIVRLELVYREILTNVPETFVKEL
jgi:hypothetical protein